MSHLSPSDNVSRRKSYRWVSASQASYDGTDWNSSDDDMNDYDYSHPIPNVSRDSTIKKLPALPKLDYMGDSNAPIAEESYEDQEPTIPPIPPFKRPAKFDKHDNIPSPIPEESPENKYPITINSSPSMKSRRRPPSPSPEHTTPSMDTNRSRSTSVHSPAAVRKNLDSLLNQISTDFNQDKPEGSSSPTKMPEVNNTSISTTFDNEHTQTDGIKVEQGVVNPNDDEIPAFTTAQPRSTIYTNTFDLDKPLIDLDNEQVTRQDPSSMKSVEDLSSQLSKTSLTELNSQKSLDDVNSQLSKNSERISLTNSSAILNTKQSAMIEDILDMPNSHSRATSNITSNSNQDSVFNPSLSTNKSQSSLSDIRQEVRPLSKYSNRGTRESSFHGEDSLDQDSFLDAYGTSSDEEDYNNFNDDVNAQTLAQHDTERNEFLDVASPSKHSLSNKSDINNDDALSYTESPHNRPSKSVNSYNSDSNKTDTKDDIILTNDDKKLGDSPLRVKSGYYKHMMESEEDDDDQGLISDSDDSPANDMSDSDESSVNFDDLASYDDEHDDLSQSDDADIIYNIPDDNDSVGTVQGMSDIDKDKSNTLPTEDITNDNLFSMRPGALAGTNEGTDTDIEQDESIYAVHSSSVQSKGVGNETNVSQEDSTDIKYDSEADDRAEDQNAKEESKSGDEFEDMEEKFIVAAADNSTILEPTDKIDGDNKSETDEKPWQPDTEAFRSDFVQETNKNAPPGFVYDENGNLVDLTPSSMKQKRIASMYTDLGSQWNAFPLNSAEDIETIKDSHTIYDNNTIYNVPGLISKTNALPPLPADASTVAANAQAQAEDIDQNKAIDKPFEETTQSQDVPEMENSEEPKESSVLEKSKSSSATYDNKGNEKKKKSETLLNMSSIEKSMEPQSMEGTTPSTPVNNELIKLAQSNVVPYIDINALLNGNASHSSKLKQLNKHKRDLDDYDSNIQIWIKQTLKTSANADKEFVFDNYKVNHHVKNAYAHADELSKRHAVSVTNTMDSVTHNVNHLKKKVFSHSMNMPMNSKKLFASIGKKRL